MKIATVVSPRQLLSPSKLREEDYDRILDKTLEVFRKTSLVQSVVEVGTRKHPGISDIDLLLVIRDEYSATDLARWRRGMKDLWKKHSDYFLHEPVYVWSRDAQDLLNYRIPLFQDLGQSKVLHGPPPFRNRVLPLNAKEGAGILYFRVIHFAVKNIFLLAKRLSNPVWDGRYLLVLLKSVSQSVSNAEEYFQSTIDSTFESVVRKLREHWFDHSPAERERAMVGLCLRAVSILKRVLDLLGQNASSQVESFGELIPATGLRRIRLSQANGIDAVWFDRISPFLEYQQLVFTGVQEWAGLVFEEDDGSEPGLSVPSALFPIFLHAALGYEEFNELDLDDRGSPAHRTLSNCYALSAVPMVLRRVPAGYAKSMKLMKGLQDIYFPKEHGMVSKWNDWLWETRKKCFPGRRARRIRRCLESAIKPHQS